MERKDELEARVRQTPLSERLDDCRTRIGKMCSEGRPPRMCIPVQWDDDDFYISTTLADAQRALRRAKAEGVRELVGHEQLAIQILDALERGGYLVSGPDGEEIGLTILDEADKFLDARAAQIEADYE